jgi:hypothetical protein
MSESSRSGAERERKGGYMKKQTNFVALLALSVGLLGAAGAAQERQSGDVQNSPAQYATFDSSQSGLLRQADWDDHRRCDGDHDRDDRGCYNRDRDDYRYRNYGYTYYGNGYYATPYYAAPYYAPPTGWYDRDGRWHAYDRDRDRDRHHHGDDDRR